MLFDARIATALCAAVEILEEVAAVFLASP